MNQFLKKTVDFLGSFSLASILLVMLTVLTLFGTLEQQYTTLDDVQTQYFESLFVVHHWAGKYPIPWPGAMLLLPLLGLNLLVGGILRLRMGKSTIGVFIIHLGIVILLFGSLIEHSLSTRGFLMVSEGETSDQYVSYDEYEMVISEVKLGQPVRLYTIPPDVVADAEGDDSVRFQHPDLPFDVVLSHFSRNARVVPRSPDLDAGVVVGDYALQPLPPISKSEKDKNRRNVPGVVAILEAKDGSERQPGILWPGPSARPFTVVLDGARYEMNLRQKRWDLPFSVTLDRFVHEKHPGTGMDRRFSSFVTQTQDGVAHDVHITMNEPLRSQGYTLYQSSWGRDGGRYFSVFSVVANPSDRVPLWSCIIIAIGMLIHFIRKLSLHLKAQSRRSARRHQEAAAGSAS